MRQVVAYKRLKTVEIDKPSVVKSKVVVVAFERVQL